MRGSAAAALAALATLLLFATPAKQTATATPTETSSDEEKDKSSEEKDKSSEEKKTKTYTVKAGDTASGIAEKSGVDLETLMALNPELDPATLSPGQKIRLEE